MRNSERHLNKSGRGWRSSPWMSFLNAKFQSGVKVPPGGVVPLPPRFCASSCILASKAVSPMSSLIPIYHNQILDGPYAKFNHLYEHKVQLTWVNPSWVNDRLTPLMSRSGGTTFSPPFPSCSGQCCVGGSRPGRLR